MEQLKDLREAKRMTQVRLAIELGVSQETISGYEIGKASPPADMLIKLADCLDASVDYILGRTEHRNGLWKSQLTEQQMELLDVFRTLSVERKSRALGILIGLAE